MEKIDSLLLSKENTAFSTQTFSNSFDEINKYVGLNPLNFDIKQLDKCLDPNLLLGLGTQLEDIAQKNITLQTTESEIDAFSERVNEKIIDWDLPHREVLNVVLVSKILANMEYANKHMNEKLLRDVLFRNNMTCDLMYIWLDIYKKRLTKEIKED